MPEVAIKDGSRGAWVTDGRKQLAIPPHPCVPVDSVGAGDAFNAGFLAGIQKDLHTCGVMGAVAVAPEGDKCCVAQNIPCSQAIKRWHCHFSARKPGKGMIRNASRKMHQKILPITHKRLPTGQGQ